MRRRYVPIRAREWWDTGPLTPHLTVYEPDDRPQDTGLLDQHGNKLAKVVEREPIGFVRLRER